QRDLVPPAERPADRGGAPRHPRPRAARVHRRGRPTSFRDPAARPRRAAAHAPGSHPAPGRARPPGAPGAFGHPLQRPERGRAARSRRPCGWAHPAERLRPTRVDGKRRLEMVNYKVNGMDQELGTIRTRMNFLLGRFEQPNISFRETRPGKKPTVKTAAVRNVIGDALNHIDRHCAAAKRCNDYFLGLGKLAPMSLRQILDGKTLYIYRLKPEEGFELTDLPAGFTEGWGPKHANIGLNELVLSDAMWTASVLLHELAHVAGAPGRDV